MSLRVVPVSKCLDKKLMMFGFEVLDIIAVFLTLSILNFLFGQTSLKLFLVWLPAFSLADILRWGKKGKPDKFLVHWLRFQMKPGIYSAFREPTVKIIPPKLKKDVI